MPSSIELKGGGYVALVPTLSSMVQVNCEISLRKKPTNFTDTTLAPFNACDQRYFLNLINRWKELKKEDQDPDRYY